MSIVKQTKDYLKKYFWYGKRMPSELSELFQYFKNYGAINFEFKKEGDEIVAISKNFRHGSIVTSAKTEKELNNKIKDAILTAFKVPSSYKNIAKINRAGNNNNEYAFAQ